MDLDLPSTEIDLALGPGEELIFLGFRCYEAKVGSTTKIFFIKINILPLTEHRPK